MSVTTLTDRLAEHKANADYVKNRLAKFAKDGSRRGGARVGAGRVAGSKGKRTEEALAVMEGLKADPVKFLLVAMLNEDLPIKDRIECAKAVAPYVSPRLASVESRVTNVKSHEEMLDELDE
jgi:hypothetical protein